MANICGLGDLANPQHIRKALESIRKYNYVKSFGSHFNNMRSYALGNESGLQLLVYPDQSKRPAIPLSYASEAWTGLEYTAATGMIYQGLYSEALQTISDVRNRYNGFNRNPFNEQECGNHYVRAMASWSALIALSGFEYSAVEDKFTITPAPGNYFWSNGYSWGNVNVSEKQVTISVGFGELKIKRLVVKSKGEAIVGRPMILKEGDSHAFSIEAIKPLGR
jgi:non-lysosomal glucosylceramidase